MKSIQTRFIGPTNTKPARVKAYAEGGLSVTISYDYEGENKAHDNAVRAFLKKSGWGGVWVRGGSADGRGNVYVCIGQDGCITPAERVGDLTHRDLDYVKVRRTSFLVDD